MTTKVIRENTRKRFTEVAVAVEEIGNSMTLTLKALAEGKQDIEHLASEVEASVDNGTEVTEKLGLIVIQDSIPAILDKCKS